MFKIATWNVNSINVRLSHVLEWLEVASPDVLALQEIKVTDDKFPAEAFKDAGYFSVFSGQKTYNGVAILSKAAIAPQNLLTDFPDFNDPQRRVMGMMIGDIFVLNLYVPNGSVVDSDKYAYKLEWLGRLYDYLKEKLAEHKKVIVLGDFNIAPRDQDVHDPKAWEGSVLVSDRERAALQKIMDLGFVDSFVHAPEGETIFSWWDYRMAAFRRNLGVRIDHILLSEMLVPALSSCIIDKTPRKWERPSDHAPVIAVLKGQS